jgi:hypothetical protein
MSSAGSAIEHIRNSKAYHPVPVHTANAQLKYLGRCCEKHGDPNHDHERDGSGSSKSEKWNKNFLSSGVCRKHRLTKCPKCIDISRSPSVDSRHGRSSSISSFKSPARGVLISNTVLRHRADKVKPKTPADIEKPQMKKALTRKAPKREVIPDVRRTVTPK